MVQTRLWRGRSFSSQALVWSQSRHRQAHMQLPGLAQEVLDLGEDLLDRVQVWRVFRQEEELGAGRADELAYGFGFVTAEIVHDYDVAGMKRGDENLFDIGPEALPVDGTIE